MRWVAAFSPFRFPFVETYSCNAMQGVNHASMLAAFYHFID
jgi:hypothetical protein